MKKASDLQRLCGGIRIAIIIEKNGKVDTFRTEDGFLSSLNIQVRLPYNRVTNLTSIECQRIQAQRLHDRSRGRGTGEV
jgi:hypothetical protein